MNLYPSMSHHRIIMGTKIDTLHPPYMRICYSMHHKVHASYACIQDHATLCIYPFRYLSRNIFVKLIKRSQFITASHYQQEVLMRKATFLKLCNICICQHLTKVLLLNQVIMKITELGFVNPCNQLRTVLLCLPLK
jgi:hypothetical protein